MIRQRQKIKLGWFISSALITLTNLPDSAIAADSIILKYGFLQQSIPVRDLTSLVETGAISPQLGSYFELTNQKPEEVKRVLQAPIKVDAIILSKTLNSPLGEIVLDGMANFVTAPSERASRESLRGALITSALEDDNIRLLEIIENYPTAEVHVQGDRLVATYTKIQQLIEQVMANLSIFQ